MESCEKILEEMNKLMISEYCKEGEIPIDEILNMEAINNYCDGDYDNALDNIRKGLQHNIFNSNLYNTMAMIYEIQDEYSRAYLCYQQALYLCEIKENIDMIKDNMNEIREANPIDIRNVSFVILTHNNLEYSKICIESIRKYNIKDTYEIVVVDNNSTDGTIEWLNEQQDIKVIYNDENKGFPVGCNQGILIANKDNDIFLLNNDTVLMPNSIFNMRMAIYSAENIGAVGAVSNSVNYAQQISEQFDDFNGYLAYAFRNNISNEDRYEERVKLIGFAMLINRQALNKVGLLDERFTPGNYEDDDISIRLLMEKYRILLCKDSYIHHFGCTSFKDVKGGYVELLLKNREKFREKWTFIPDNTMRIYGEIVNHIGQYSRNVLQINCGTGSTLVSIRNKFKDKEYYCYETNNTLIEVNKALNFKLIDNLDNDKYKHYFDEIIITELNQANDRKLMQKLYSLLKDETGQITVVFDAFKENKKFFSIDEVEEFKNKFVKNNFILVKDTPYYYGDGVVRQILSFRKLTEKEIRKYVIKLLDKGYITEADNYLSLIKEYEMFDKIDLVRELLRKDFEELVEVKFILRRIDVKRDDNKIDRLFEIIEKRNLTKETIINIINNDMINKEYLINYIEIKRSSNIRSNKNE